MASLAKVRRACERLLLGREAADRRYAARIRRSPDRQLLEERYLPAFAALGGRILWVGCRPYTADYPTLLEALGAEVWTTDIAPGAATWGREGRHRTGDIRAADALFGDLPFDSILLNGVFGYGVDAAPDQRATFQALASLLRPGGVLLIGWNIDRTSNPVTPDIFGDGFQHAAPPGLEPHRPVAGTTHVYDCLIRAGGPA